MKQPTEALAAIVKAESHIYDILDGTTKFKASVPSESDDSALIICDALEKAKALLSVDIDNS